MFVLSVSSGPTSGQAIQLIFGGSLTLGRGWEANIHFEDPALAELHAEVSWGDDGFSVLDFDTEAGTWVNGARIQGRVRLKVGDHLQLGAQLLQLREADLASVLPTEQAVPQDPTAAQAAPPILDADAQQTVIQPRKLVLATAKTESPATWVPPGGPAPKILSASTMVAGRFEFPTVDGDVVSRASQLKSLLAGPDARGAAALVRYKDRLDPFAALPITIGRERENGVVLDDPAVSQRHAVLDFRQGRYQIRDVGSSNGTFLNQKRVVEQELVDGDIIGIGHHNLLVVIGPACLGVEVQAPSLLGGKPALERKSSSHLGVVRQPLGEARGKGEKRKKRKAADLVWYATSDLDKGVFRARSALVALFLGIVITGWMLARGDSEILVGSRLSRPHENTTFTQQAAGFGRDRCTACHVGAGKVATLKCLDCHPDSRPLAGHASADLACASCHGEHKGTSFRSAAYAAVRCTGCHAQPHERLARTRPKLVASFSLEAPAGIEFHHHHQRQGVKCLSCHGAASRGGPRGVRGACAQCHAPEHPTPEDCRMCHRAHPDRTVAVEAAAVSPSEPPAFATKAVLWSLAMLVLSFVLAAMVPRTRKVVLQTVEEGTET